MCMRVRVCACLPACVRVFAIAFSLLMINDKFVFLTNVHLSLETKPAVPYGVLFLDNVNQCDLRPLVVAPVEMDTVLFMAIGQWPQ